MCQPIPKTFSLRIDFALQTNAAGTEILRYAYDAGGRLTNRWSLAKGNTRYAYDASGNLTMIDYPSSADIVLQYDALNRVTNMVDASGTTLFRYTDFGALLSENGPWSDDTITYDYTTNRLRQRMTLLQPTASSWQQTYTYDNDGRLVGVAAPSGAFQYSYDPTNHFQISKLTLPTSTYITNTFDFLSRLTSTSLRSSSGVTLNSHAYTYDAANRRISHTRGDGSYSDYSYDSIGQLKAAKGKESGGTTNRWQEQLGYAYDAAGNLAYRSNNVLLQTFSVGSQNEIQSISRAGTYTVAGATWGSPTNVVVSDNGNGPNTAARYADATFAKTNVTLLNGTNVLIATAFDAFGRSNSAVSTVYLPSTVAIAYDANGNLTTNGTRIFQYDDENQLICATQPGAWMSTNVYDGKMRRRIRKEYAWQNSSWTLTAEVRYIYADKLVLQERDGLNNPLITYTRGRDISGTLDQAGGVGGLLARTENWKMNGDYLGSAHAYYHADGNGNITTLIDTNQNIVARYSYDPFGNPSQASGPLAEANIYRYSSKEAHDPSGLVYYLYRFYDPGLQRWLNRDPIMERGGNNYYAFCLNSPISAIDPYGLVPPGFCPPPNRACPPGYWWALPQDCVDGCNRALAFTMVSLTAGLGFALRQCVKPAPPVAILLCGGLALAAYTVAVIIAQAARDACVAACWRCEKKVPLPDFPFIQ